MSEPPVPPLPSDFSTLHADGTIGHTRVTAGDSLLVRQPRTVFENRPGGDLQIIWIDHDRTPPMPRLMTLEITPTERVALAALLLDAAEPALLLDAAELPLWACRIPASLRELLDRATEGL